MLRLLGKSKVWGRGYTTIPVTVRKVLDLCSGDEIEWYMGDGGEIIIRKSSGRGG
jgi:bifunctional DNA-binding transcriptional regulator/antitoxin component of YhaV-PrlF toxin-antitoxin module